MPSLPERSKKPHDVAPEDAVLTTARARAAELGCLAISPDCGAALRMLAAAMQAKAVVEVGTGTGVSGLWVLRGMRPDGVLTSIDSESELQSAARLAFREAGVPPSRARLINGRALDVLPRLADGYYDLVLISDAPVTEYPDYLVEALRLLRPGGAVAFGGVLLGGRVAEPGVRDPITLVARELLRTIRDHPALTPAILPVDDGLLVAVRR
ncbi:O-methyltransferase [Cryptosporangium phraense]|uniref:O-methyltransferase n=2 Tax=Cryptosporangium phraense TaxID=2593070 RepID=A0A545AZF0_9ACTN|nr:O-methyltransferase [Cryptosporangium phraense]